MPAPEVILHTLVEAALERVEPLCPHFGACGGCQLQHLPYTAQATAKNALLLDVLQQQGIATLPEPQVHVAEPWRYRNRIRLRIKGEDIGYSKRESNEFLPIETCLIAAPLLETIAFALRNLIRSGQAEWPAEAVAFELFTDAEQQAVQLAMHLEATVSTVDRDAPSRFRKLCDVVQQHYPQLVGAGLLASAPNPQASRRVQSTQRVEIARWGAPGLTYTVGGIQYHVTRNAFFQVNRFLTEQMVDVVVDHRSGKLVFDLFAGAGLFSVPLAERFQQVVSVEIGEPAATDLRAHVAAAGPSHTAVHSTSEAFLQRETRRPDLVVMDPPRAGVSLLALRALARLAPAQIVYVSCDAGTFARDAKTLLESGYTLAALHLFDLFPQTAHTETIAVFQR